MVVKVICSHMFFLFHQGKHVAENSQGAAAGAVAKHHKRQYRQYMNRKGGFNRPLQKID